MSEVDAFDVRRVREAGGLLRVFNDAGVLAAADVHVARRLAALAKEEDEQAMLAAALAVRAPRLGHVHVDLATIRETAAVDSDEPVDLSGLPWPDPGAWIAALPSGALVAEGEDDTGDARPLRLVGSRLYLDRYWREERRIAADLAALAGAAEADEDVLGDGLARLFELGRQRDAAAAAVRRGLAVVAGGPGTGKTTTVARIVALLAEQAAAAGAPQPLVALAAPTGKAAARLEEAVHEEAAKLDVDPAIRTLLDGLGASTMHRLLGWRPGSHSRFRHDRGNRLPHDVVIVDETSMVSLSLMARLVEAVRPQARLILVGDPGQLTSIEAGAVLGDIVGPAATGPVPEPAPPLAEGIVVLDRVYRFRGAIAELADAIRLGRDDEVMGVLRSGHPELAWIETEGDQAPAAVRAGVVETARSVVEAARAGEAEQALRALGAFRVLCAHRRGPHGVSTWTGRIESWIAAAIDGFGAEGRWYVGRPLLVTENDYELQLYNGDTGVVVARGADRVTAAFERRNEIVELSPARLGAVDTVHAMTVHKSQGSQFHTAAVLLPEPTSQILTRELLYTAVTRAQERLILVGTEDAVRAAVGRPVGRASGLGRRLWGLST